MLNLEDFIIDEEAIARISDEEVLLNHLEEGKPLQELFGFTNEVTAEFYEAAKNILEQKRFEDAINAFVFLTTINPYMSDFWVGLGMAHQQNNQHDEALFSYSVAFNLDGRQIFPYVLAAQCCMEVKDFERALEVVDSAVLYAEVHNDEQGSRQLKEDAVAAREYVRQQQRKG